MNTHYKASTQMVSKLIRLPFATKTTLTTKAAAHNLSLTKYIEGILTAEANEEAWLAPYFHEPLEYASPAEAKATFAKWRERVQSSEVAHGGKV